MMKFTKDLALMAAGMGLTIAYQKYSEPIKKKVQQLMDGAMHKVNDKLEDMM